MRDGEMEGASGSGLKILLVDDEPRLVRVLARMLRARGHEPTIASNGLEAWELFEAEPELWDVVVTDIQMPKLDGVGLARRVRAEGWGVRVLFISGYGAPPNVEDFSPASFLAKPFPASALLEAVQATA